MESSMWRFFKGQPGILLQHTGFEIFFRDLNGDLKRQLDIKTWSLGERSLANDANLGIIDAYLALKAMR